MAQPYILITTKWGGLIPEQKFSFETDDSLTAGIAANLATGLNLFYTEDVATPRWRSVIGLGTPGPGGALANVGTISSTDFDDFHDCTYVSFVSGGPGRPSSVYIPGRNDLLWSKGTPTTALLDRIDDFLALLMANGVTDSEGFAITGIKTVKPSRREHMKTGL